MYRTRTVVACLAGILMAGSVVTPGRAASPSEPQASPAAQNQAGRQAIGAIKSIDGNTITLTTDSGASVKATLQDSTKMVRVEPGQADLKNAPAIQLSDLQVGDRILVRGKLSDDGSSIVAVGVIAMKRADVDAKRQQERADWQKRGIGGLVTSVDASSGVITISVAAPGGAKPTALHTTKATIVRRYAPDSVNFDDAKVSALEQIKPGDQLRARGTRSADGSDFAADEVVAGTFRNIAGTLSSIDATAGTMQVMDLITKKAVLVKVTPQSQVVKLPPQMAQGIALRLKAGAAPSAAAEAAAPAQGGGQRPAGTGGGGRQGGADLQQILSRMPPAALGDFQKGDAVMIVSTEGSQANGVTAITLLGGVEPILAASPSGAQGMNLSPWSLGGGDAGEAIP